LPVALAGLGVASVQCGLFASPGEYASGGAEASDGGAADAAPSDATGQPDVVVLPDGNVVTSAGTLALVAGEREPLSVDDDPAWSGDAWSATLSADGHVASWKIDKSAPLIGPFDSAGLVGGKWMMINVSFGLGGGRGLALQSTSWAPGTVGDWRASRASAPGGLDDHTRVFAGPRVLYIGGTRTVPIDGGTSTSFTREVHGADIDVAKTELGPTSDTANLLVNARSRASAVVEGALLYVAGGRVAGGGVTSSVELAKIDPATGSITDTFVEQPAMQAGGADHRVFQPSLVVAQGYLFVAGGRTNGANAPSDVVLSAKIDLATGALSPFQEVTKLPQPLRDFAFVAHKGVLYVAGGITVTAGAQVRTDQVLSAKIAADGTLGSWETSNANLPAPRSDIVARAY